MSTPTSSPPYTLPRAVNQWSEAIRLLHFLARFRLARASSLKKGTGKRCGSGLVIFLVSDAGSMAGMGIYFEHTSNSCQASKKGVLILSEFAGAAQSLGAGAILVNPWNITEVAASIAYALNMPADEREKRHQHNFMHVTTHTSQEWAATFVSELNDTIVEAQLRTRQVPPLLPMKEVVDHYLESNNRLLILVGIFLLLHFTC
ncbi:alpha,alpha-trehalose-phosphate synthase [UDP-forming] 1-like [Humulus lupulus]|uniref:alpha,alpha-trehalose-phosphate synthase [UDP-forming] 1-like n=1 Tax=Humulus lupulus TaxID=3486 RepID=UPI002B4082C1|nr:alpha,alpha-trehalose-phosphate synthase [UDP-forming] 1-like [Humulus lupulus]